MVPKMVHTQQVAAFVNPGYGKTIVALTALIDVSMPRTLVVAPARVAQRVWQEEAAAWEHTKDLRINHIAGTPAQRTIRLAHRSDIDVISYDLFDWLTETVDLNTRYGAIVFDELSKMKTPGSKRFKRMRYRSMQIPIRFGLTGNPVGNHYLDLWGEMFAVAGDKPLGPSKVQYAMQYFTAIPIDEHVKIWSINHGAPEIIQSRIVPWSFSIGIEDAPPLPPLHVNKIAVDLPKSAQRISEELGKDMRSWLSSGTELLALSSSARAMKCRQITGGAVYLEDGSWEEVHSEKLDAMQDVVEELQGSPALVFYWYKHEKQRILKKFPQAKEISDENVDAWNRGEIELLLCHPASAGHGLNLQFGGSNIIWYTLPWSYEMWLQSNRRLVRPGQKSPTVMAHVLMAGDVDDAVLQCLKLKQEANDLTILAVQI